MGIYRDFFGIFGVVVEDFGSWVFRIFGEFSEFSAEKDKKITGFENIEIHDMGCSVRYESFSDVGEIRVYFASKILTPCRMH